MNHKAFLLGFVTLIGGNVMFTREDYGSMPYVSAFAVTLRN